MVEHEELITAYEVDVRFPDVSGMEHLEMLALPELAVKGLVSEAVPA